MKKTLLTIIVSVVWIIGLNYVRHRYGIEGVIVISFANIIASLSTKEVE